MPANFSHRPVLLNEVLGILAPSIGERVLDCTTGLGGHAAALLEHIGPTGELVALDADEQNLSQAKEKLASFGERVNFIHANFRKIPDLHLGTFDIILADLGVSSPHLDDASRGFSYRYDGPLDMRFDRTRGATAAQLIAHSSLEDVTKIFWEFGEIRQAKKIALALTEGKPTTTAEVEKLVGSVLGFRAKSVLPQVFQALRIAVNNELGVLQILLDTAPHILNPQGRLGIIAFHSLEDRMVKRHFRALCTPEINETTGAPIAPASFSLLTRHALQPTEQEVSENSRSRSARFRAISKSILK